MFDLVEEKIRRLAKSTYWQNLYRMSKECANIQLVNNICNFSGLQTRFFYWLSVYNLLYEERTKHEDEYLSEQVINDFDRCDAYLIYRNKKYDHLWKKYRQEEKTAEHKARHPKKHKDGKSQLIEVDLRRE